jgi:multiple sugar transport system permease protein
MVQTTIPESAIPAGQAVLDGRAGPGETGQRPGGGVRPEPPHRRAPVELSARRLLARRMFRRSEPYLYLLPALLSIVIWVYRPLLGTLELSVYQWNLLPTTPRVPVGLDNYRRVLTLPEMGQALVNTGIYVVGMLPFSVVLPLGIALLVQGIKGRPRGIYRAIIFTPMLIAPVVVAVVWRWMLHPLHGVLNVGLAELFGTTAINWFRSPDLAIWAIVGVTGWKLLGFSVLLFSAGLTGINQDYLDAAGVDGASGWQIARYITLPLLSPTVTFVVLLTVLLSGQWTFPMINVLTGGGPVGSTASIYYLMWELGFRSFNVGVSSAAAVLFFVAFGALALLFTRLMDRLSFYDS